CAAVGAVHGQSDIAGLPEPCRAKAGQSLAALEKSKDRLERAIARAREKSGKAAEDEDNTRRLTSSQKDLLEGLFQIDWAKARQELAKAEGTEAPMAGARPLPPIGGPPSPPPTSAPTVQAPPGAGSGAVSEAPPAPAPVASGKPKLKFAPSRSLGQA